MDRIKDLFCRHGSLCRFCQTTLLSCAGHGSEIKPFVASLTWPKEIEFESLGYKKDGENFIGLYVPFHLERVQLLPRRYASHEQGKDLDF